ncbi:MAG: hypothetical protein K0S74_1813 [Chlamydiales bacterium]|jgi:hypothetical protein|nr:hypothetical protein [Chlamydiales bacterium]
MSFSSIDNAGNNSYPNLDAIGQDCNKNSIFEILPNPIKQQIFGYLDGISLIKASYVSKLWEKLANSSSLWSRINKQALITIEGIDTDIKLEYPRFGYYYPSYINISELKMKISKASSIKAKFVQLEIFLKKYEHELLGALYVANTKGGSIGVKNLKILLEIGINPNTVYNMNPEDNRDNSLYRYIPLIQAWSYGNYACIPLLLEYGAKATHSTVNRFKAVLEDNYHYDEKTRALAKLALDQYNCKF